MFLLHTQQNMFFHLQPHVMCNVGRDEKVELEHPNSHLHEKAIKNTIIIIIELPQTLCSLYINFMLPLYKLYAPSI